LRIEGLGRKKTLRGEEPGAGRWLKRFGTPSRGKIAKRVEKGESQQPQRGKGKI